MLYRAKINNACTIYFNENNINKVSQKVLKITQANDTYELTNYRKDICSRHVKCDYRCPLKKMWLRIVRKYNIDTTNQGCSSLPYYQEFVDYINHRFKKNFKLGF